MAFFLLVFGFIWFIQLERTVRVYNYKPIGINNKITEVEILSWEVI
tara:strand:+ start:243 stop:380 length:138 start_codon:yes stop_codon:yes gene_type:complete